MNSIIGSIIVGIFAGIIDTLIMIIKKMDKYAIISAFIQYLVVSFIIAHINIPGISWWVEGPLISLLMIIPVVVIIAKNENKAIPIIIMNALVLGLLISIALHHIILS